MLQQQVSRRESFKFLTLPGLLAMPTIMPSKAQNLPELRVKDDKQDEKESDLPFLVLYEDEPDIKPFVKKADISHQDHQRHPHKHADHLRAVRVLDTPGNRRTLALTMWGEARGYGEQGMRCVGHVILNRAKVGKDRFGHTVQQVCLKHKQFSCWNKKDPNKKAMACLGDLDHDHPDWQAWIAAVKLAGKLLMGIDPDNTGGATFYVAEGITPYWRNDMILIGVMYGHEFFKERKHTLKHRHHH